MVAATSVDYAAFLAPLLMWTGVGVLTVRLSMRGLAHGRHVVGAVFRPMAGSLSGVVAVTLEARPRSINRRPRSPLCVAGHHPADRGWISQADRRAGLASRALMLRAPAER